MTPQLFFYDTPAGVTAFSTTRHGGVSKGNYASFNINAYCGDESKAVTENRSLLCKVLNLADETHIIIPHQTHGTVVRVIDETFVAMNVQQRHERLEGVDAVITDVPELCIGVSTADCIPIIIYDSVCRAVAAVHAGWRGTVARIVQCAVRTMHDVYGSEPGQMQAWIGPGISLRNFEVGQEVYDQFLCAGFPMSHMAERYEKWHIDLPACNQWQLEEAGLSSHSISRIGVCTYDNTVDYFSARRLGVNSGRIYTGVFLQ